MPAIPVVILNYNAIVHIVQTPTNIEAIITKVRSTNEMNDAFNTNRRNKVSCAIRAITDQLIKTEARAEN